MNAAEGLRELARLALEHRTDLDDMGRCRLVAVAAPELYWRAGGPAVLAMQPDRRRRLLAAYEARSRRRSR